MNHLGIDVEKKRKCMITLKDERGKTRDQFFFGINSWNTGTNLKDTELYRSIEQKCNTLLEPIGNM